MINLEAIEAIQPSTYNPRSADPERLDLIELSLRKLGFLAPIFADRNGEILSGHQRHLVANSPTRGTPPLRPFIRQIEQEEYRQWLIDLLRPHRVILITARPNRYQEVTLARIKKNCRWEPMDAYFAEISSRPHMIKEHLLQTYILPKYGENGSGYFGLESNLMTRGMYARYGIQAIQVTDQELKKLPGTDQP